MCFSKSPKTPKTNPDTIPAPEPVLTEEPKGIAVGDEDTPIEDKEGTGNGKASLKVAKDPSAETPVVSEEDKKKVEIVKTSTPTKAKGLGSIKRSLNKATKQPT